MIKIDEANFRGVPENRVQHIVQAFQGSLHIGNVFQPPECEIDIKRFFSFSLEISDSKKY